MQILKEMKRRGHEEIAFYYDKDSELKSIIAIHNTFLGPALGGVRMWNYRSEEEALEDVLRLSRGMTYKSAAAGINLGGGKAVIIGNPRKDKSESLFRAFGRFVNSLNGRYITAEDVGTTLSDMLIIKKETKFVTGLPVDYGSSGDPSPFTAYGVYCGMKACLKEIYGNENLKGKIVVIQGLGNVGYSLAEYLYKEDAKLIGFDVNKERCKRAQKDFNVEILSKESDMFNIKCDIFSPCALGSILNSYTIPRLKCRIIAGSANNQLQDEEKHSKMLFKRKILYATDFVINAGGIINISVEVEGKYDSNIAKEKVSKIYDNVSKMIEIAKKKNITTYSSAILMAVERLKVVR
jgi:leucine dehydrogenase